MNNKAIYDTIHNTVQAHLPGARVLLFGSRARGEENRHSDYDLLVITQKMYTPKENVKWYSTLDRAIVYAIHAPVDLLIYSEEEVFAKQQLPGHIVRTAMREGITI